MINGIKHKNTRTEILKYIAGKAIWHPLDDVDIDTVENFLADAKEKGKFMKSTELNISNPCDLEMFEASRSDNYIMKNIKTEKYDATTQNPLEKVEEGENNFFKVENQTNMFEKVMKSKKKSQNIREIKRDNFNFEQMVHTSYYHYSRKRRRKCLHWMYIVSLRRIEMRKFDVKEVRIEFREGFNCKASLESNELEDEKHTYQKKQTEINDINNEERLKCNLKILNHSYESKFDDELKIYKYSAQHSVKDIFGNDKKIISDTKSQNNIDSVNTTSLADELKDILPDYLLNDPDNKLIRLPNLKNQDLPSWMQKK